MMSAAAAHAPLVRLAYDGADGDERDELVIDAFAGGGGASVGIEQALGRPIDVAINHDAAAIAMHAANHPRTRHYLADVWAVDPVAACGGRRVGLFWLSPQCQFFSKAKGGRPRDARSRSQAWLAVRWARAVRPRVIMLENVEEFCFPATTAVMSKRGMVPIGDIRVGDEVWTHNARWKPVTATTRRRSATVSVIGYGNSIVETTPNHRFYARAYAPKITASGRCGRHETRLLEPEWVRADRLADVDDSTSYTAQYSGYAWATPIALPRYWMRLPRTLGVDASSPAFFYMLGRWLGDGWFRKRKQSQDLVRICANRGEADGLAAKLTETGLAWHRSTHTDSVDVFDLSAAASKRLIPWIKANFGEYSWGKTLPAWVFGATEAQRRALVEGWCDADGHERAGGIVQAKSVSRCLAVGFRLLLQSLGIAASISETAARDVPRVAGGEGTSECRAAYTISWRRAAEFERGSRSELHLWGRVREVRPASAETEVVDITVADDHSFIADGQVVHNCDWGRLDADGMPNPRYRGETFRRFVRKLEALGYVVEHRELVAADYGAPTSRRRLFLIARCDGRPIAWPAATHGPDGAAPWRTAAEIIDWSVGCPSIFGRRRPLRPKTLGRIAAGVWKYVIGASRPFIVPLTHQRNPSRVHSLDEPLRTVTGARRGELALVTPTLEPAAGARGGAARAARVAVFLSKHYTGVVGQPLARPIGTLTAIDHHAVTAAFLTKFYGSARAGAPADGPLPTITAGGRRGGGHIGAVQALLRRSAPAARGIDPAARRRPGVVVVDGDEYVICDLGMRMLQPGELFAAQGFPPQYAIAPLVDGKPLSKTAQTDKAGNSVCPPLARALVAANYAPRPTPRVLQATA